MIKGNKALTFVSTFALLLSLGACNKTSKTAYALVGDFVDSNFDSSPSEDSIYYIPKGTSNYQATIQTSSKGQNARFVVMEYGTRNVVLGYDSLNGASTGIIGGNSNNYILLEAGATYQIELELGGNPSILVNQIEGNNTVTSLISSVQENHNYYAESYYLFYQSETVDYNQQAMNDAIIFLLQCYGNAMYATEDALLFQSIGGLGLFDGGTAYYTNIQLYVNNNDNTTSLYEIDWEAENPSIYTLTLTNVFKGTWEDNVANIADLADYKSSFKVASKLSTGLEYYGDIENYSVDDDAYDILEKVSVGNNYIWDSVFGSYGWNNYLSSSAKNTFYGLNYYSGGYYTNYMSILEIIFASYGWFYAYEDDNTQVFYQDVEAYTDIDMSSIGKTSIPSGYSEYLNS